MRKGYLLGLFALAAIFQLAVPSSIILRHEDALKNGEALKFRTRLYDPYDPFRGRYVQLGFELSSVNDAKDVVIDEALTKDRNSYRRQRMYVSFAPDENGFATVKAVTEKRPTATKLWLQTSVYISERHPSAGPSVRTLHIAFPFDKYFMNEKAAPEAERIFRQENRRQNQPVADEWANSHYLLVHLLNGTAAAESLIVNGQRIEALLRNPPEPGASQNP